MSSALDLIDASTRSSLPKDPGGFRPLMLATLTERRFSDESWLYERKLDGVRTLAVRAGGAPELWSRNEKRVDDSYPELVEALAKLSGDRFAVDGEIVAFDGSQTSFAQLQGRIHLTGTQRIKDTGVEVFYYLFDLLALDGACERGWEGLIAKRADSPYRGGRSTGWLKFKCVRDQEFVVGGFTDPRGSRAGFGALLVGYHEDGQFRYAGKVGTGYSNATLKSLYDRMAGLTQEASPFADPVREPTAHWVKPELVVQVGFTEWTTDGRLRHPRYTGLREDKRAADVVRETR